MKKLTITDDLRRDDRTSYLRLVRRFPLLPIRTEEGLRAAREIVEYLRGAASNDGERAYCETLCDLIKVADPVPDYQTREVRQEEILDDLMRRFGFRTQTQFAKEVGINPTTMNRLYRGHEPITKIYGRRIARRLGIKTETIITH